MPKVYKDKQRAKFRERTAAMREEAKAERQATRAAYYFAGQLGMQSLDALARMGSPIAKEAMKRLPKSGTQ
jgi:hypothetical protein